MADKRTIQVVTLRGGLPKGKNDLVIALLRTMMRIVGELAAEGYAVFTGQYTESKSEGEMMIAIEVLPEQDPATNILEEIAAKYSVQVKDCVNLSSE